MGKAQLQVAQRRFIVSGQLDGALEMLRRAGKREQTVRLARGELVIPESASAIASLIEVVRELLRLRRGSLAGA